MTLKTLEQIKEEVGPTIYNDWYTRAEREVAAHPTLWDHADARHASIYGSITRAYLVHTEGEREYVHAHDPTPQLWEGE